jgi:SET domain-containing protein
MLNTENHTDHPLVIVKKSKIHGNGLFARKNIKAGEIIGEVKGKPTKKDGPYVLWMDNLNKGFEVSCVLKYINHHRQANACYYDDLTVVAIKDIKKGEEITHNYGDEWE